MQTKARADLIVRLTKDPEIMTSQSGTEWARLSTVHFEYQGKDQKDLPHFFTIKVFGKGVEGLRLLSKGDVINVEGDLRLERWTDKNGANRYETTIRSTYIRKLIWGKDNPRNRQDPDGEPERQSQPNTNNSDDPYSWDDDTPF